MVSFQQIGSKIREARLKRNLNQKEVAEQITELGHSISRETFNKIENGNRSISILEMNAICRVLGIKVEELMRDFNEDDDQLVTLFRKNYDLNDTDEEFLNDFQNVVKSLIAQEKIYYGTFKRTSRNPSWKGVIE